MNKFKSMIESEVDKLEDQFKGQIGLIVHHLWGNPY